jgi:MFS family permease
MSVMWYRRTEQISVVNFYQAFVGVSSIISGLLGFGFYQVSGGKLFVWQYLFLMVAGISILMGAFVMWYCPDSPTKAKCFSEEDKLLMVERVRANDQGIKNTKWNKAQFIEAITDIYCWDIFLLTFMK